MHFPKILNHIYQLISCIIDKRIEEQIQSGIILMNSSNQISLTSKGLIISGIYHHVNSLLDIKDKEMNN